jgi:hypothetical protein
MSEYVQHPVTGNYGYDVAGTVQMPAPQPEPGYFLATQSRPLPVIYQGWLYNGAFPTDGVLSYSLQPGESLQAFFPEEQFIPESAGESPGGGYIFTVVRVVTSGGWRRICRDGDCNNVHR